MSKTISEHEFTTILDQFMGQVITADDIIDVHEANTRQFSGRPTTKPANFDYSRELHATTILLRKMIERGVVVPREHKTFFVLPVGLRPSKTERIGQELYRLEADETRITYASDVARTCGYSRDDVVEVVRTLDRSRFRNCVPAGGGRVEIWFLRHVGSKRGDPRRADLSSNHKSIDRLVDLMIDQLRVHAPHLSEGELHDVKMKITPIVTRAEDEHFA